MKYYFDKILEFVKSYILRKKYLYRTVGIMAVLALFAELAVVNIPESLIPNYSNIENENGYFTALLLGWVIEKYASGPSYFAISVELFLVMTSLILEYMLFKQGTSKTVWNFFIGLNQNITQNYD